jgi:hypothetical protein
MKRRGAPKWRKNTNPDGVYFDEGESLLVAVKYKSSLTRKTGWDIQRVWVQHDGDGAHLYCDEEFDEPYDSWSWHDVNYYIRLGA